MGFGCNGFRLERDFGRVMMRVLSWPNYVTSWSQDSTYRAGSASRDGPLRIITYKKMFFPRDGFK